jgi:hypothetical protein
LIAVAALFSTVIIFVFLIFLELVGIIEYNIKNKTDYLILWEWWWNKDSNGESIIDLAEVMPFDWDYFVVHNLGNENDKITVNGKSYSLLQDEIVSFVKDDKVVFSEIWYKDDYTYQYFIKGSVHFRGNCSNVKKEDAKFRAKKNEPGYLILEKIE